MQLHGAAEPRLLRLWQRLLENKYRRWLAAGLVLGTVALALALASRGSAPSPLPAGEAVVATELEALRPLEPAPEAAAVVTPRAAVASSAADEELAPPPPRAAVAEPPAVRKRSRGAKLKPRRKAKRSLLS